MILGKSGFRGIPEIHFFFLLKYVNFLADPSLLLQRLGAVPTGTHNLRLQF